MSLPSYRSHKIVRAAKIVSVGPPLGDTTNLVLELPSGDQVEYSVSHDYMTKHPPKVGGYLVVYDDGYESWSPADAFEKGYHLLEPAPPAQGAE